MLTFISASLLYFAMPRLPERTQTQPFYGPGSLTYSPFPINISIDRYYYKWIKVTAIVADRADFEKFNLTVCSMMCPLPTVSDPPLSVTGHRSNDLVNINYYVNLRDWPCPDDTSTAQYFALYMLQGSSLTFVITRLLPLTDVQLCITDSVNVCGVVFNNETNSVNAHQVCLEVLTFDETNNLIQTYTVKNTGYYCAVWILKDNNQLLNYTVNITRRSYSISTGRLSSSEAQCRTHQKQTKTQFFELKSHNVIAFKGPDPVCIAIRITGDHLHNKITLLSMVVTSKVGNITFVLGVLFAGIGVVLFVTLIVCSVACC